MRCAALTERENYDTYPYRSPQTDLLYRRYHLDRFDGNRHPHARSVYRLFPWQFMVLDRLRLYKLGRTYRIFCNAGRNKPVLCCQRLNAQGEGAEVPEVA